MNKLSVEKHQKAKDFIITSSLNILAKKGYANLSVDDIAKEAGYSKGGLLHYFSSKDEIMVETISSLIRDLLDSLFNQREKDITPKEELRKKLIWTLREAVENKVRTKVILDFLAQASNDAVIRKIMIDYNNSILAGIHKLIEEGKEAGQFKKDTDAFFVSSIIISTLYGLSWRLSIDYSQTEDNIADRFDLEGYVDRLMSYFLVE